MKALVDFSNTDGWGLHRIEDDFKAEEKVYLASYGDIYAAAEILWLDTESEDLKAEKHEMKEAHKMIMGLKRP